MRPITISLYVVLTFALLLALTGGACAASQEDNADRLSASQSYTFSPGYNNAAIRNAEWKVRKALKDEDKGFKNKKDDMDKEIGQNMKGQRLNKPEPKLQMKSSQQDTSRPAADASAFTIDDKTREAIISGLANQISRFVVGIDDNAEMANTLVNLDLNGNGKLQGSDASYMSRINMTDDATFRACFSKIMAEVRSRIGQNKGDAYYLESFDINKDGMINLSDYGTIRQAAGYGRSSLPDTAFYRSHFNQANSDSRYQSALSNGDKLNVRSEGSPSTLYGGKNYTDLSSIARDLLKSKITSTMAGDGGLIMTSSKYSSNDQLDKNSLAAPIATMYKQNPRDMEDAMKFADSLKNPSQDQKTIIDAIKAFMQDMNKVEQEAGQSPELTKAQDDLIQMVANVLLAQAMPDLISKGEMANITDIFKKLNDTKSKIMNDYNDATEPYFASLKRDIERNMAALESSGIFSKGMLEQELKNASRSQMEKITEKLKASSIESSEKDYIRQREAHYKEKYLDPNNKDLENKMRAMMNGFTGRLKDALEAR